MRETVGDILNKHLLTEHLKRDSLQKELAVLKKQKGRTNGNERRRNVHH
jgi:hypothetical protein